jgi:hypothetical protein
MNMISKDMYVIVSLEDIHMNIISDYIYVNLISGVNTWILIQKAYNWMWRCRSFTSHFKKKKAGQ